MENGSNISEVLHDEINIMFTDWPMTKGMEIKGTPPPSFFKLHHNCIFIYPCIYCITKLYISTNPN